MDEFEQAYADAANLSALTKPKRKLCAHRTARPAGFDHTTCTECGARFAVVPFRTIEGDPYAAPKA